MLEGQGTLGDHVMRSGDWHVARPESSHVDLWSKTGRLLFIRAEMAAHPKHSPSTAHPKRRTARIHRMLVSCNLARAKARGLCNVQAKKPLDIVQPIALLEVLTRRKRR